MNFQAGSLVRARGREWIVQPNSNEDFLVLQPLGGRSNEEAGIYLPIETVEPASFELPSIDDIGDARSAGLLRDAVTLSFRSSAGPFRSFGRIAVEPRSYQLVPLLMALKLEPVRLLIADDVGIGKTVEALMIARELLDRGEVSRLAVLCPPHLAEQWQKEMADKFHIDAELVLPSTVSRLEHSTRLDESIFDRYSFVIVSTDYIKADRRREEFLRSAPELVIVDEAHTCADSGDGRGGRHQRYHLLKGLSSDESRHLILVTATPHSGKEEAFRSLLVLLKPAFSNLPDDLTGRHNEPIRRELAYHFVQRKRADITNYLQEDTPFPERHDEEVAYTLAKPYKELFNKILRYAREIVDTPDAGHRQRVRWWAALGLLRALASSPRAAAATLRNRAAPDETNNLKEADEVGRKTVLDQMDDDAQEGLDVTPGSQIEEGGEPDPNRERLLRLAREAEGLEGKGDEKIAKLGQLVKGLISSGHSPIVFCRFIQTAEYVAEQLRDALPRTVEVKAVTGTLPPSEREVRVLELGQNDKRVLVATDCLSEGINLQESFNAVIHYDLSWNPTRHEQREGRIDRYGQSNPLVEIRTMYGLDNQIDGIVLDVLIRKHKSIRSSLGISVPVPTESEDIVEAIFEGLLLRSYDAHSDRQGFLFENLEGYIYPQNASFQEQWEKVAEREKRSRTMFAQEAIKVDDVQQELKAARGAIGSSNRVAHFLEDASRMHGATVQVTPLGAHHFNFSEAPQPLKDTLIETDFEARFSLPVRGDERYLGRTHPIVEGIASYILDTALDQQLEGVAKRAGVIRTDAVTLRTTLLLIRFRHHITTTRDERTWQTLAEEAVPLAFRGAPSAPDWLSSDDTERLFEALPAANVPDPQKRTFMQPILTGVAELRSYLEGIAKERAEVLLAAHRRVRDATNDRGRYSVEALLPADVLGVYIYLPAPTASRGM